MQRRRRTRRILSAYTDDRPFSVDLIGAVMRQCSFIDKMDHYGWTKPGAFDSSDDEVVLLHSVARYHAYVYSNLPTGLSEELSFVHSRFLDLMATSPGTFFVPTLDIDLAWHTHQLKGDIYQADCKTYVGRYVDQWGFELHCFGSG